MWRMRKPPRKPHRRTRPAPLSPQPAPALRSCWRRVACATEERRGGPTLRWTDLRWTVAIEADSRPVPWRQLPAAAKQPTGAAALPRHDARMLARGSDPTVPPAHERQVSCELRPRTKSVPPSDGGFPMLQQRFILAVPRARGSLLSVRARVRTRHGRGGRSGHGTPPRTMHSLGHALKCWRIHRDCGFIQ